MVPALGFWGWVKILFYMAPQIIDLVSRIVVLGENGIDWLATRKNINIYKDAVDKAQQTGDTSDVEAIFKPRH